VQLSDHEKDSLMLGLAKLAEFEAISWQYRPVPIELLRPGKYQMRQDFNRAELEDLAATMVKTGGNFQPINIRPLPGEIGSFEILAGERRWRAAQMAGFAEMNCLCADIPDSLAMIIALIENIQRKDLNPVEEAEGFRQLVEEGGMSHMDVAAATGKSRATVTNSLRLLTLDIKVRDYLRAGKLEGSAARTLAGLEDKAEQRKLAIQAVRSRMNVRQLEAAVAKIKRGVERPVPRTKSADISRLENEISERSGFPCKVTKMPTGAIELTFRFADAGGLDDFLEQQKFRPEDGF